MSSHEKTAQFWDRHAEGYAKAPIKDEAAYNTTLERTRSYLTASDHVLEIGAGTGTTALQLAPSVAQMTATDISPAMMQIATQKAQQANISNVEFRTSSALVPELEGPYDAVMAFNLLHLLPDMPSTITRVHELLAPGGVFISKTFCQPRGVGPPSYYAMRAALPVMRLVGKAPFVAFHKIEKMEAEFEAGGFDIIESGNYPASEIRRYIVARKLT